jgi:hypothetical protein
MNAIHFNLFRDWDTHNKQPGFIKQYVFEEAMHAVYGRGVWKWYNSQDIGE